MAGSGGRANEAVSIESGPPVDEMGVWSDSGETIWLPREHYPKRSKAIAWAVAEWGCDWLDVRCRSRWMQYAPHIARDENGAEVWRDHLWVECAKDVAGAFPVWKLEGS